MTDDEYTPHGDHPPTPELTSLRLRAEQLCRDEDDGGLLALVDQLRDDVQLWPHLWGPSAAIAASRTGRGDALGLLRSVVDSGFSQPELFEGVLEERFGDDPAWDELVNRMNQNVPTPTLVIVDWPDPSPEMPLTLYSIAPDRADAFAARLPAPEASAWTTAQAMLTSVRRSWEHANDHVDDPDGLDVLERVDSGERFACVEYSIVLSQALNAVRIPARRLDLRQLNHHVGVGRGHVVSEAWIDDLDQWVVLDGQNGAYWINERDEPLCLRALQRACRGDESVRMRGLVDEMAERDSAGWLTYFASVTTTGYTWAEETFSPVFQGVGIIKTGRLLHDGDRAYPRLSDVSIALAGSVESPVLRLSTQHPYVNGFRLVDWAQQQMCPSTTRGGRCR
ncbi:MAG: hypothetical protein WKF54_07955 [Nocardioidaceae bacterium]